MLRVSVPYASVHVGDVIDDLGQLAVVTFVGRRGPAGVIHSVGANGQRRETVYPAGSTTGTVSRVGEGCAPSPQGLHDFIVRRLKDP
jgi:hypothetical protein